MSSHIAALNIDIVTLIFDLIQEESPPSVKSLAAVNRYFRAASKLVADRKKEVLFQDDHDEANRSLQGWLDNSQLLRGLRELTVGGNLNHTSRRQEGQQPDNLDDTATAEATERKWGALTRLLRKLGNLKILNWNYLGPVPEQIIRALEQDQQQAELKVWNWQREDVKNDHNNPDEQALAKSPALTTVTASIWNEGQYGYPDLREAAFCRIVATAPNLRYTSLSRGASGCCLYTCSMEDLDRAQEMAEKFWTHDKANQALRTLLLDGYGLSEYHLRHWSRFVDLSKLETLDISNGWLNKSFNDLALVLLKNLKHLSLNCSSCHDSEDKAAVVNYLTACPPLETLRLWSWLAVPLPVILNSHGHTLKLLLLHESESVEAVAKDNRKVLSKDDLTKIKEQCPRLQDLTIDLNRRSQALTIEDNKDVFAVLSQMNLRNIQLYYDLGIHSLDKAWTNFHALEMNSDAFDEPLRPSKDDQIKPHLKDIWKLLFGNKLTGERALDVKFGEWERSMGAGYPASWVIQEQSMKSFWRARPEERDDRPGCCTISKDGGLEG